MPVPQENSLFVEQAGKPVLDNGARCEVERAREPVLNQQRAGSRAQPLLPTKQIDWLWNGHASPFKKSPQTQSAKCLIIASANSEHFNSGTGGSINLAKS